MNVRTWYLLISVLSLVPVATLQAAEIVRIGVVTDGPLEQQGWSTELFKKELHTLAGEDFDIRFPYDKQLDGAWSARQITKALQQLQNDPHVDMVLALGYVSSAIAARHIPLHKPTFAPFIIDANIQGLPEKDGTSGIKYLNYLNSGANFLRDLQVMNSVAECKNIAVFLEQASFEAQPGLVQKAQNVAATAGIELTFVEQRTQNENLVARLSPEIQCIVITGLGRISSDAMTRLIKTLNARKIPSYSLLDASLVKRGVLMSEAPHANWLRLARRNALNMHAVLHGELTAHQPVTYERKRRLTINMATARAINIAPRFDVLNRAKLINEIPKAKGQKLSLAIVAEQALAANLDLRAAALDVEVAGTNIDQARAQLFPQLNARVGINRLNDDSNNVISGAAAEQSSDAAITLRQILYSDSALANVAIERYFKKNQLAIKRQLELDIIVEAVTTYLNVLKAQTLIQVQQEDLKLSRTNLEHAKTRQRIGVASPAEIYRWQIRLSNARRELLRSQAQLQQSHDALNRLLNRPLKESFIAQPATLDDPRLIISRKELFDYVNNDHAYERLGDFMMEQGAKASPELAALDALINASQRELQTSRRAYWSPTITLQGEMSHVFDEERVAGLSAEGDNDWSLGINVELPLLEGGARAARVSSSQFNFNQLLIQRDSTLQQINQRIRASLHDIEASYPAIQLSKDAALAAKKNLDLVTDAYTRGAVSVIDLLDAQNASLIAQESATNAVFDFLIDLMNLQRNVGRFDYFLKEYELDDWLEQLRNYIAE